jgi:glutaminyl-tRNA synthetase
MNFIEEKIIGKDLNKLKLRFPPEPNGHLHLGHAKSICLNFGLAEKYNKPCNLRFDDTNPSTENVDYVESIKKDIEWLGFKPSEICFTSNYFTPIYACAIKLIKNGLAYVDDSSSEEIAATKGDLNTPGTNSIYRNRTVEDNLTRFENMRNGAYEEGFCTLRLKIDMSSPNMILRDPVIYRINKEEHHNTGNKWCIYPMYDFAHPISDYIESISDSLCTLEFEIHRPLYNWILENLFVGDKPEETEFARLNVTNNVMSKRKLKTLVEEGHVTGWDDPRLLTLSGLRRKGYTPSSIKTFCDIIGYTKRDSTIDIKLLEECLRNDLNKNAVRYMCVLNPIKLVFTNYEGEEICKVENNPENEEDGYREMVFTKEVFIENDDFREEANNKYHRLKLGGEVRLKGAYIIKANEVIKDELGNITEVRCTIDTDTKSGMSDRKIKGTIHWVSAMYHKKVTVKNYVDLFSEENFENINN